MKINVFFLFLIVVPRISHDPARYPRFLPEAYCLCKGCLAGPKGEESDRFRSIPVYVPTVVLRRAGSCVGGRHSYIENYVSVAVGCTCVPVLEKDRKTQKGKNTVKRVVPKTAGSTLKLQLSWKFCLPILHTTLSNTPLSSTLLSSTNMKLL